MPAIPVLTLTFLLVQCDFDFDDAEAQVTTFAESCRTADQEYFHLNVTGAQCCPKGDGACQGDNTPPPEEIPPPTNETEKRHEDYFVDTNAFCQCQQAFPNDTFYAVRVSTYEVCDWYNQTGGAIDVPRNNAENEGTVAHVCVIPPLLLLLLLLSINEFFLLLSANPPSSSSANSPTPKNPSINSLKTAETSTSISFKASLVPSVVPKAMEGAWRIIRELMIRRRCR